MAAEVKAGRTIAGDFFRSLEELRGLVSAPGARRRLRTRLVYGGDAPQKRRTVEVVPWDQVSGTAW